MEVKKYEWKLAYLLDLFAYVLTYPWLAIFSLFLSCYWSTNLERKRPAYKAIQYVIYGPILGLISAMTFPMAVFGYCFWILFCFAFSIPDCTIVSFSDSRSKLRPSSFFTFVTSNVLLGVESMGKFQNMPFVYGRLSKIQESLRKMNGPLSEPIENAPVLNDPAITDEELMDTAVSDIWPHVDFICFQEVWDRYFTMGLIKSLRPSFQHFIVDITRHSWGTNLYFGTSGLMVASRYPILEVRFHVFPHKNSLWQRAICYGVLMAKLDLGQNRVGYLANLHYVAYQGEQDLIGPSMTETQEEFNQFRKETQNSEETVVFATICGDFNFDNISPGDASMQSHPLFRQYQDFCMKSPGHDKKWTVGTEHRQLAIYEPELKAPKMMKNMMVDHTKRRFFIIDADISEQTMDLMYCQPEPDNDGEVRPKPYGGKRRIDRILVDTDCHSAASKVVGYQFLTCLAGQTDHVPVALSVKAE